MCEGGGGGGGMPLVTDASSKLHGSRFSPPNLKSCMTPCWGCPHFRDQIVHIHMSWDQKVMSLLVRCPYFRGPD